MDTNTESKMIYTHPELLLVADTVAREKGIDKEEVLEAMEQAIQKAGLGEGLRKLWHKGEAPQ